MNAYRGSDVGGLLFIPYLILAVLVVMGSLPSNISGLERLELGLFFAPLFFISLTSENDFTPIFLGTIGLLSDLIREAPLGYWAFLFVVFYAMSLSQRTILQNAAFGSFWVTYSVLVAITYLLGYLTALLRDDMTASGFLMLMSCFACILSFPLIFGPLYLFRDRILSGERG